MFIICLFVYRLLFYVVYVFYLLMLGPRAAVEVHLRPLERLEDLNYFFFVLFYLFIFRRPELNKYMYIYRERDMLIYVCIMYI